MRRILGLALLVSVAFTVVAVGGTPDPWRIAVTDLTPNGPNDEGWVASAWPESFGAGGGIYRQYYWTGQNDLVSAKHSTYSINTYSDASSSITFGASVQTTIQGWAPTWNSQARGPHCVLRVSSSLYKVFDNDNMMWDGHDVKFATSTDGANFSAITATTVYGSTVQNTGAYGTPGIWRTTGGVYVKVHCNSFGIYQEPSYTAEQGIATSGVGETEWWDIDTKDPVAIDYPLGDPIAEPHTIGTSAYGPGPDNPWHGTGYDGEMGKACDGNLFIVEGVWAGAYPSYLHPVCGGHGLGLVIGTAGETAGGDHYLWLSDPDSHNTQGIGNSLLSSMDGVSGLSGPSLRTLTNSAAWQGAWFGMPLPMKANRTDAASKFLLLYGARWDTDSSGISDVSGSGFAKLGLTRNKADLNFDGTVSALDISGFSGAYGSTSGQGNYNPDCDFNGDGKVSALDISGFSGRYGSNCNYQAP